ncbi:16S rRNA (guanine(527)-N(7))-methyltransferase RsmG [Marinobacterium weihaiense]|uniref:Ribosomal RNA small subunit methyltransferase G n=1 Tax=Marinobacterium weihaiense TaxID=2851016 RepID=A0ABS6MD79_9GAMM|nr:16S rRNA (guanine(527)-N(7))-methyltransferase RsmG [Marinobacterium weihaiense]MBV0933791.1 16S rRNA (guanine(527)-N(7))-methyltransferase RsmG [Marinobacterium weihaiense]
MSEFRELLLRGVAPLQIDLSAEQIDRLLDYHRMLVKWNKAYNLTAVRDPAQMISRHLVDSLSVLPWIGEGRLLDVGSGPGLPGVPLAICRPDLQVTTLDSNGKKTRFQVQVKAELGLDNLNVINGRVEAVQEPPFDMVISRAFASLADMLNLSGHLVVPEGIFLAMKGLYPEAELAQMPAGYALQSSHRLALPAHEGERHLLILGRA